MSLQARNWKNTTCTQGTFSDGVSLPNYIPLSSPFHTSNEVRIEFNSGAAALGKSYRKAGFVALAAATALSVPQAYEAPSDRAKSYDGVYVTVTFPEVRSTLSPDDMSLNSMRVWLSGFYTVSHRVETSQQILPLITVISQQLSIGRFTVVDKFLQIVEVEKLSTTALMSLMRTTYAAKKKLPRWQETLTRVSNQISARGELPGKVLRGLV